MDISVVIPLFNEEESLVELTDRIVEQINLIKKEFEIVFIDDGSTDKSFEVLTKIKKKHPQIKIVQFNRNFGKSAALFEGFKIATGDIVITMDADLQDAPEEIPNLVNKIESGFDLVSGWKKKRHDPLSKTLPSKLFNFATRRLTGIKIHDFNCGLKAYRTEVIKAIPVYGELHRYLPVLAHWLGFHVGELIVTHHPRKYGNSKFGIKRFFNGFFDLLTVLFITRFRQKPLHLFGFIGLGSSLVGSITLLYLTVLWFQGYGIGHRPLFILGILLITVGIQFFSIGLIGEMIINTRGKSINYTLKNKIQ